MSDGVYIPESDDAFQAWQKQHPEGYVINAPKTGEGGMMWHQAQCMHIYGDYDDAGTYMHKIKACATNPGELAHWAKQRPNSLSYCQSCQGEWAKRG